MSMAGIATSCLAVPHTSMSQSRWQPSRRRNFRVRAEINYVTSEEAKQLVSSEGYGILDVRDRTQFERARIKSCRHVPLFIENKDNDFGTIINRTLHNNFAGLLFGLPFTKRNPEFVEAVRREFSPESKVLIVCQEGLRSVAAAQALEEAGFQNLTCIAAGLQSVSAGAFDCEGPKELKDAGKAGLVTIQAQISGVLGTILICALLFITFFPDQAEQILALFPSN